MIPHCKAEKELPYHLNLSWRDYAEYFKVRKHKFVTLDSILATPSRKKVGIYFLVENEELVYVGQSKNIHGRVATHNVQYDSYHYVECSEKDLDEFESAYIHIYQPVHNADCTKAKRAPWTYRKFIQRVRDIARDT